MKPHAKKPADAAAEEEALEGDAVIEETYRPTARADAVIIGTISLAFLAWFYSYLPKHSASVLGSACTAFFLLHRAAFSETEQQKSSTVVQNLALFFVLFLALYQASFYALGVPFAILVAALLWPWSLSSCLRLRTLWAEGERPPHAWTRPAAVVASGLLILHATTRPTYHLDVLTLPRTYAEEELGPPHGRAPGETRVLGPWGEFRWLPEAKVWIGAREMTKEQLAAFPALVENPRHGVQEIHDFDGRVPVPWYRVVDYLWRSGYRARGQGLIPPGWMLRPPSSAEWMEARDAGFLKTSDQPFVKHQLGDPYLPGRWQSVYEWIVDQPGSPPKPWTWGGYFRAAREFGAIGKVRYLRDDGTEEGQVLDFSKKKSLLGEWARLRLVLAPAPRSP